MELVVFISDIFNDFVLNNFLIIENNLLNNQKLIWLTTNDRIIDKLKNNNVEFLSFNISKDDLINYPELPIDTHRLHPDLSQLYLISFKTYPNYDNYWFIENDVKIIAKDQNNSFKVIFEYFKNSDYDIIADHIKHVISDESSSKRYLWFCNSLLSKYNIDPNTIWKGFFTFCRFSNKILKSYSDSDDIFKKCFFEISFISFANKYGMSFFSLDTNNLFSIENKLHPFLNYSEYEIKHATNTGSNAWRKQPYNENQRYLTYHDVTILHAVKTNELPNLLDNEKYDTQNQKLKIWVCGNKFEIPSEFDTSIYNKFDLAHKYNLYNVNEFNRIFSEFVMMYYIYANNIYSKYVGTAHYHRYPIESKIDLHRIEDDEIQFFYFSPNRRFKDIETYEYPDFAFIEHQVNEFGGPNTLIHDMIEYLKSNTHLNINEIIEYTKHKEFITFIGRREIFVMKWEMFIEMCQFIEDYIHYVSNKYSIYSLYDWIEHVKTNIIEEYRKKPKEYDIRLLCYQSQEKFNSIYNDNYGYDISNCWRAYSYMIEILVSIYIGTHKNFYVSGSIYQC